MVVAGADSSARAGIAADQEAIEAQGLDMRGVVSVWTRQDAGGVQSFSPLEATTWEAEALGLLDQDPAALKLGLLPGVEHLEAAARLSVLALERGIHVILDPVLRSSSGFEFLNGEGVRALRARLLVQRLVVTPNLLEAPALCAEKSGLEGLGELHRRRALGDRILAQGAQAVLLKGGHGAEDPVQDLILERDQEIHWHAHPRLQGRSLGGSGCRYASSVAAALGAGLSLREAASLAGDYVLRRMLPS